MARQSYHKALQNKSRGEYNRTHVHGKPRKSKLGVPKVNPDPKAPNEPKSKQKGQSNVGKGKQNGNKPGQKPDKPKPSSPQAPGAGGGQPAQSPFAPPVDPRDSQYWSDVVSLQFNKNAELQGLGLEESFGNTNYQEALRKLNFQEPKDVLARQEGANRAGEFYSSKTGEDIGGIATNYFEQRSGLARNKQQEDAMRNLTRNLVENGYTVDQAAAYASAVGRQSDAESDRPMPEVDPISTLLDTLRKKKGKGKGKGKQGGGGGSGGGGGQSGGGGNQGNKGKNKGKGKK